MRYAALVAVLAMPAAAQTAAEDAVLQRIIESGCFELMREINGCEQVTLLTSETEPDAADLIIYPDRRTDAATGALLVLRGAVFNGAMWGMAPSLDDAPGGFRLRTEQSGIGRFPWFESINVAHDGRNFVVTGYSYSSYDRAWPRFVSCEVDFETGVYRAEGERGDPEDETAEPEVFWEEGQLAPHHVLLRRWRAESSRPVPCIEAANSVFRDD